MGNGGGTPLRAINKNYLLDDFLQDAKNQNVVKSIHLDVGYDPRPRW